MRTAYELFITKADASRDLTAVITPRETWTYGQLSARVDDIAAVLHGAHIVSGDRVGVALDGGAQFVATVLAIWKLGAVFVPLPPHYPASRLNAMVDSARPAAIVATGPLPWTTRPIIDPRQPATAPSPRAATLDEHAPAYIIFTSGSTGTPKGVVVGHRGIEALVRGQADVFAVDASSRVLQFAALGFDAVISELIVTLASGAALVIPTSEQRQSVSELVSFMRETHVTVATFPPSLLELLAPRDLPELATVVAAGEPCPLPVVRAWAPGRRFVNAYGPTEGTVCATMAILSETCERVVVGRPITDARVYLLGDDGTEVPAGEIGELVVAGPGVALGYWERPDETAAAFIRDPRDPAARAYRTGDLGRLVGEDIELLGRRDHQVKVAGYRIELGDVEAALRDVSGSERVLAFVVRPSNHAAELAAAVAGARKTAGEIKLALSERVPSFMVPSRIVLVDEWPLTHNGKIDRARLESLAVGDAEPSAAASPHATFDEIAVAAFQAELGQPVSLDTDFFAVGGTSLKMLRMVAAVERRTEVHIPVAALLAGPVTPRRVAQLLVHRPRVDDRGHLEFHRGEPGVPLVLIPPVTGDPLVFATLAHWSKRPVIALRTPGLGDGEQPLTHVRELAQYYAGEVRRLTQGPVIVGGYSLGGLTAYRLAGELQASGTEVKGLVLIEAPAPPSAATRLPATAFANTAMMSVMLSRMLCATVGHQTELAPPMFEGLAEHEIIARLRAELIRVGAVSPQTPVEHITRRLELFRTNLRAHGEVDACAWDGPTAMVWSEEGHLFNKNPAMFDWSGYLKPALERRVAGNHFTLLGATHAPATAEALRAILDELRA